MLFHSEPFQFLRSRTGSDGIRWLLTAGPTESGTELLRILFNHTIDTFGLFAQALQLSHMFYPRLLSVRRPALEPRAEVR
jgi:hypothetical protein